MWKNQIRLIAGIAPIMSPQEPVMPQQEVFFEQESAGRRIEVLKTSDRQFAREAFTCMDEAAQAVLWNSLQIEDRYDPADLSPQADPDNEEFLWEELVKSAHEDGNLLSFFVVNEGKGRDAKAVYVSPDWPSAEAFAKHRIAAVQ